MKIAITGASGLIGTALRDRLSGTEHTVIRLVRDKAEAEKSGDALFWNPYNKIIESDKLENIDAVVHLSGENIAERWTDEKKRKIRQSRIESTAFLTETLLSLQNKPLTVILSSATGFYGDRGDEILTESSSPGQGFLADLSRDWEKAGASLVESAIRTLFLRIGVVLTTEGGALSKMLPAFKTGVGGKIGDGKQYVSWIAIDDLVSIIEFGLNNPEISGPINAVSPNPVTNKIFTEALGEVLGRPTVAKIPAFAIKMMFGEMGKETVLSSARVIPEKLQNSSFQFRYPEITGALTAVLKE